MSDQTLFNEGYNYARIELNNRANKIVHANRDPNHVTLTYLAWAFLQDGVEDIDLEVSGTLPLWYVRGIRSFVDDLTKVMHGMGGDYFVAEFNLMKGD